MTASRRGFLLGLGAALAAPAVVRAESLMNIAVLRQTTYIGLDLGAVGDTVAMLEITNKDGKFWVVGSRIVRIALNDPYYMPAPLVPISWPEIADA